MPTTAGVIDAFLHPPLGAMSNYLDANGPYAAGNHELTTWLDGATPRPVGGTFGALIIVNGAIPASWGYSIGASPSSGVFDGFVYENRFVQVLVQHALLLGLGGYVTTDQIDCYRIATLLLWTEALPGRIVLDVAPGIAIDLQYLRAL